MRRLLIATLCLLVPTVAFAQGISQLNPWVSTSSPIAGITQASFGRALIISGISTGNCLTLDSNRQLTTTSCGSGGGGAWPFTTGQTNYGVNVQSTTTPEWFKNGLMASTTSYFANASTSQATINTLFLNGDQFTDLTGTGLIVSGNALTVSGLTTSQFASANISQWTNNSGYITGIAWGAITGTLSSQADLDAALKAKVGTSTNAIPGNVAYWTGFNTLGNAATTSVTCSGTVSCTGFNVLGSSPITITGSAGTSASSTLLSDNNTFSGLDTFTKLLTISAASTTDLSISHSFFGPNLTNCTGTSFLQWTSSNGQFGCGTPSGGSGADAFTHASVYGQTTSATSTLLALTGSPFSLVASSTSEFVYASTTAGTFFSNLYLPYIATFQLLETDGGKNVIATTSIGNNLLQTSGVTGGSYTNANITVNDRGIVTSASNGSAGGGGSWPFTIDSYNGLLTQSTTTPFWLKNTMVISSSTYFTQASTTMFTNSGTTWLTGAGLSNSVLSTDQNGKVVATTSIGLNYLSIPNASASLTGLLTSTDWGTFSGKLNLSNLFNIATTFGTTTLATTTPFWAKTGIFASSTSQLDQASSTEITTGTLWNTGLTSALALFDGNHKETAYGGASACSANNFVTTLSAVGGTTCGTAAISGVNLGSNLNSLSHDGTLGGTSYNGSATVSDWGLNLANANTWTGLQKFSGAGTTTIANGLEVGGKIAAPYLMSTSTLATSTFAGGIQVFGGINMGSGVSGFLKAVSGVVTTSLVSLTADVTGILPALNGGTGKDFSASSGVLGFNAGTAFLTATSSTGFYATGGSNGNVLGFTNGVVGWVATSTSGAVAGGTAGMLTAWTNSTTLTSTSSPTFAYFFGTSTATSTLTGGLNLAALNETGVSTSTFVNGINLSGGCFSINGTCVGGGSGGTPGGSDTYVQFNDGSSFGGNSAFVFQKTTGKVGIGTTTPWGLLSIASTTLITSPLFVISTSTNDTGFLTGIWATSTIMERSSGSGTSFIDSGVRWLVGAVSQFGLPVGLDQLFVQGRINTGDWATAHCEFMNSAAAASSDTTNILCGQWTFQVDTQGSFSVSTVANGGTRANIGSLGAASGSGIFLAAANGGNAWAKAGQNTPVFETVARINAPQSGTSTIYVIGITSTTPSGTSFEVMPTDGCFFTASTTAATGNWYAVSENASAGTFINTGVASSSNPAGTGSYLRFRVEYSNSHCRFFIQQLAGNMVNVADITTNINVSTAVAPGLYKGQPTLGQTGTSGIDFTSLRFWWRTDLVS